MTGVLKLCSVPIPSPAAEFANTWFCLGGILLPLLYFLVVKTFRLCVFPNCKWELHVAAITKLRHKTHSPCVRRQGVCHTIPVMAVTAAPHDGSCKRQSSNTLTIPVLEMPSLPPLPSYHTSDSSNGNLIIPDYTQTNFSKIRLNTYEEGGGSVMSGDEPSNAGSVVTRSSSSQSKRELPRVPHKNGNGHKSLLSVYVS